MSNTPDDLIEFLNGIFALSPEEIKLYEEAFIHSSNNTPHNNQRLAFLGDSVLRLIIREHFFKNNPGSDIGELTKICGEEKESDKNFANIAIKLGLVKYMNIENPPLDYETNETINAEALEALFGAIYLNRGFEETKKIAEKYILTNFDPLNELARTDETILEGLKTIKNEIGHFPTPTELSAMGRSALMVAINRHGGINRFLQLIGTENTHVTGDK